MQPRALCTTLVPEAGKHMKWMPALNIIITCFSMRRYLNSKNDPQLRGSSVSASSLHTSCSPQDLLNGSDSAPIDPCGLVAWSYFNDTFLVNCLTDALLMLYTYLADIYTVP